MSPQDEHIKRMMERAFEQAFQAQIVSLYSVYTVNSSSVDAQRSYTKKGIENAVASYRLAIAAVDAWDG